MALKTAGTKLTTSLQAMQWQPSGLNATDFAALNALIRNPVVGAAGAAAATGLHIENGILYLPGRIPRSQGIPLKAGDWICVDGAGWVIVIPDAIFSTSWQHS